MSDLTPQTIDQSVIERLSVLLEAATLDRWKHEPIYRGGQLVRNSIVADGREIAYDVNDARDADLIVAMKNALPAILASLSPSPIAGKESSLVRMTALDDEMNLPDISAEEAAEIINETRAECVATSREVGKLCERLLGEARFLKTLVDADIKRSGTMESTTVRAGLISDILTAFEVQAARIAAMENALEPSADTKGAYIGEVKEGMILRDEEGEDYYHEHTITWDATKDTMKMIRAYADSLSARALLNPTPTEER